MAILGRKPEVVSDTRAPIVVAVGDSQPSLYDVVTQDDGSAMPTSYTSSTVIFYMRPLLSRTPSIEGAAARVVNPPIGDEGFNIAYDWSPGDRSVEGPYMAWWGIEFAAQTYQETPEFPLLISDHGPGLGTPTGAVVDGIGQYMPVTFTALRSDIAYGDRYMQRFADRAKRETLGYVDTPDIELTYDPQLIDYLSKLTAKHLIAPAMDYWGRQWKTRTTQSPVEIASYPDQIAVLQQLHAQFCRELPGDLRQLRYYLGSALPVTKVIQVPESSLERIRHQTPDPRRQPAPRLGGPYWEGLLFP